VNAAKKDIFYDGHLLELIFQPIKNNRTQWTEIGFQAVLSALEQYMRADYKQVTRWEHGVGKKTGNEAAASRGSTVRSAKHKRPLWSTKIQISSG
jgi:hypothetical protein